MSDRLTRQYALYAHPLFDQQLANLQRTVEAARGADPTGYRMKPAAKILDLIRRQMYEIVPANPDAPQFRQGNTLGKEYRQWFRAKFHQRYRLFFRFSTESRTIAYVWMNDETSLRKAGSKTDPYIVFQSMLDSGEPPQSLDELLARSRKL